MRGGLHINSQEKAEEMMIFSSCQRPYMRGFHGAWLSFFFAFLGWFAFAPLMTTASASCRLVQAEHCS